MRFLLLLLALLSLAAACAPGQFTGKDAEMMAAARIISNAVNSYHSDTAEWPESLALAESYLPPGTTWPVNPYNGKEIGDTGSPDFDPDTSVGMVYLQKMYRDGQLVNCQLHVFGERGTLYIISNTAFGVKK